MSGTRPFDDARWPDHHTGHAECFLCGRPVDPHDPKRGTFEESPAGPQLPVHLPCLHGRKQIAVSLEYHKALMAMSDHSRVAH